MSGEEHLARCRLRPLVDVENEGIWPIEACHYELNLSPMRQCFRRFAAMEEVLCSIPDDDFWKIGGRREEFEWFVPREENPGANVAVGIDKKRRDQEDTKDSYYTVIFLSPLLEYYPWPFILAVVAHELAHFFLNHKLRIVLGASGSHPSVEKQQVEAQEQVRKWGFEQEADVFEAWSNFMATTKQWDDINGQSVEEPPREDEA